ncbi:hypothetical protein, partial [uncultured Senegalimassilia sp.]|uniref:hypothetical protein n=1 Tax=uncultured Senegalimassilia sp. TaxID=1714350 RepID=UPI0025EC62CB
GLIAICAAPNFTQKIINQKQTTRCLMSNTTPSNAIDAKLTSTSKSMIMPTGKLTTRHTEHLKA